VIEYVWYALAGIGILGGGAAYVLWLQREASRVKDLERQLKEKDHAMFLQKEAIKARNALLNPDTRERLREKSFRD
jgi:hypothetical protein